MRFLVVLSLLIPALSEGAACCGSNSLFPALISGDERMQLTVTSAYSGVAGDAAIGGKYAPRISGDFEDRMSMRMDVATIVADRWQVGAGLPLIRRSREAGSTSSNSFGIGDLSLTLGFEALPEWSYSSWRPKVFVFAGAVLPTARAPIQAEKSYQVDSMGRGFVTPTFGLLAQKAWRNWDAIFLGELHVPFSRTFETPAGPMTLVPGLGGSLALGAGWSLEDFRIGAMLSASMDGPIDTNGLVAIPGNRQATFPIGLQASFMISDLWSASAIYTDSTLIGGDNAPLSRTISFLIQTRWER